MKAGSGENLLSRIQELENRLAESEQLIDAIKTGEVDAFAINSNNQSEVYTLQSGDYAYRILIEEFGEGAINLTEDGLIVYTNTYFFELLELSYEKVVGSSIFNFIHPDYENEFKHLFIQGLTGRSKGEINLFVNSRIIPVYISLTSLQPKLPTVGMIVTDLTEKKAMELERINNEKTLALKNIELERSNAELASFTYVASHDLQEPLRKIQTFSDRILEKEFETFSDKSKDYFQRIIAATIRMKDLITALLNYSRTNTSEITFTPTPLNAVLEDVMNNMKELIEDTHAIIETSPLPTLNIIPHQFNQLFLNIIGNAIKYRKPGINPLIKMSADIILVSEMPMGTGFKNDTCWKINITDNGIGFEQQYSERIFELFQRLNGKSEYEGTGIGLSICKKIVQNHHGFINAHGQLGIGSTFSIYLPNT